MSFSYPIANKKGKCLVFSFERITDEFYTDISKENGKKYTDCLRSFGFETKHYHKINVEDEYRIWNENKDIEDFTVLMIVIYGRVDDECFFTNKDSIGYWIMKSLKQFEIPKIVLFDSDAVFDIFNDIIEVVEKQQNILFYTVPNDDDFVDEFCKVFQTFHSDNFLDYFVKLNDCVEKNKLAGGFRGNFICNMNRKITF